ncbi:MAG: hypothetical protein ACLQVA_03235 [Candidatus Brocadiia bacterium]
MHKVIMAALLAAGCLSISGCMTFDQEHDRQIVRYWKNDIRSIHEDIDFILYCDEDSGIGEIYLR